MATEVNLPALGESVTEGTITRWLKQVGDTVEVDEPLVEVSTDKVDTEIPSPAAGTLLEIKADEDDTVEVGAALALLGGASEAGGGGRGCGSGHRRDRAVLRQGHDRVSAQAVVSRSSVGAPIARSDRWALRQPERTIKARRRGRKPSAAAPFCRNAIARADPAQETRNPLCRLFRPCLLYTSPSPRNS